MEITIIVIIVVIVVVIIIVFLVIVFNPLTFLCFSPTETLKDNPRTKPTDFHAPSGTFGGSEAEMMVSLTGVFRDYTGDYISCCSGLGLLEEVKRISF